MSEDLKERYQELRQDVKELYQARDDHNVRLSGVEIAVLQIKDTQKELKQDITDFKTEINSICSEIQNTIGKFITEINGIPKRNKLDISEHETRIKNLENIKTEQKGFFNGIKDSIKISWIIILILVSIIGYFVKRELDCRKLPAQKPDIGVESNKSNSAGKETPKNKTP